MCLNHSQTIPYPWPMVKLSSMKLVLSAKKVWGPLMLSHPYSDVSPFIVPIYENQYISIRICLETGSLGPPTDVQYSSLEDFLLSSLWFKCYNLKAGEGASGHQK